MNEFKEAKQAYEETPIPAGPGAGVWAPWPPASWWPWER